MLSFGQPRLPAVLVSWTLAALRFAPCVTARVRRTMKRDERQRNATTWTRKLLRPGREPLLVS